MKKTWQIFALIAVGAIFITATDCIASGPTEARDSLLRLLDQYRLLRTLHLKESIATDYKTIPPGIFHVEGTQEYWADGSNYRILQLMNSAVFPGMSHDVRWDGEHYQWFNMNDSTLVCSEESKQKSPYIGEPIALLPLEFLNPSGEDLGVKLSFQDIRGDAIRTRISDVKFTSPDSNAVTFSGGSVGDIDTTYRLEYDGPTSYLPTTIRRISSAGVELDTDEIRYQPVKCDDGTVYLPDWARMTDRTSDNRVVSVTVCNVTQIETNRTFAPEAFTIDYQTAKRVIDIDHRLRPISASVHQVAERHTRGQPVSLETSNESNPTLQTPSAIVSQTPSSLSSQRSWTMAIYATSFGVALLCVWAVVAFRNRKHSEGNDDNEISGTHN